VRLDRPAPARDVLTVLPTAELPLEVVAEDPQYGIRDAFVEVRTGANEPAQLLVLHDHREDLAQLVSPLAGGAALAAPPTNLRPTRMAFQSTLALAGLRHADGEPLHEGDVVVVQACADDFDDVAVDKEPGRSHQVEIRIVGRNALEIVLGQEQARVQQELLRLRQKERDALQKVTETDKQLKKGEKLSGEDSERLLQAEQTQQQIRERVGDDKEGLRAEVGRILQTLKQNDMHSSAVRDRMRDVARELSRLGENELQQIEPRLTEARKLAELLDEKARAERRQRLEAQAREAEQEAKAAEEGADRKEAEAERSEKAAQGAHEPDRTRLADEARRQRDRAAELRRRAGELRRQAERARREADRTPTRDQPRQALADARKGQEQVEKTLNELLERLESWSNSREIKGEAKELLEEQKKLQADTAKMMQPDKEFIGRKPEELDGVQRAELDATREAQQKVEERTRQLLGQMERVAAQQAQKDPETARELRDALEEAKKGEVTARMKAAREQLQQNNLNQAQDHQRESVAELQKLVKNLEDRREAELDRLAKKMRQAEDKLKELYDEQERLQKKAKEAAAIADPKQREEALQRLARQQKRLQKQTEEALQQLSRLKAGQAGQMLGKAGEQMEEAGRQLSRGQQAQEGQEEVLDRLDEALQELEQARKQAEDELAREQLARVADVINRLKERHESLTADTDGLQRRVLQRKGWTLEMRKTLLGLRAAQKGLAEETDEVAEKQLGTTPVFARTLKRAAEAMAEAGDRAGEVARKAPDAEELPDAELGRLQGDAGRRLAQVLEAVKAAAEEPQRAARGGGGGGGGEGGGGGGAGDNIPPVAQYKMLRDMQADVNRRTEAFRKKHPDLEALDEKQKNELQSLRRDQQDVRELLDEMNRPAGEPAPEKGKGGKQ
jgi:hypothetical protein